MVAVGLESLNVWTGQLEPHALGDQNPATSNIERCDVCGRTEGRVSLGMQWIEHPQVADLSLTPSPRPSHALYMPSTRPFPAARPSHALVSFSRIKALLTLLYTQQRF